MSQQRARVLANEIPDEVRRGLVNSLFADSQSMISGSVLTVLSGFVIAIQMRSWAAFVASIAAILVTLVRVGLVKTHQKRAQSQGDAEVLRQERIYVLGASAYLLCIGVLTICAFAGPADAFVMVLALFVALTNALSIAVRNFAIQYGIGLQLAAIAVPLGAAFIFRGGLFPLIIVLLGPLCLFIYSSATRLRNILLSEMGYRRQSETIAKQFDFAINNMSHGMCMISADKKILVSNAKFAEILGLPEN